MKGAGKDVMNGSDLGHEPRDPRDPWRVLLFAVAVFILAFALVAFLANR